MAAEPGEQTIDDALLEILRCPVTGARLRHGTMPDGGPALVSDDADQPLAYPIRAGVPALIPSEGVTH